MKRFIILALAVLAIAGCKKGEKQAGKQETPALAVTEINRPLNGKRVLMIVAAKDFRDEEYLVPKELLIKNGAEIITASTVEGEAKGAMGTKAKVDKLLKDVKAGDFDAIVFVGGPGTPALYDNPDAQRIAKEAVLSGKVTGAICLAPVILARAGLLKDKVSTCFSSAKGELESKGAKYQETAVAIDGSLITANGPESAAAFAEALVKALSGQK